MVMDNLESMDYIRNDLEDRVTWIDNCYSNNEDVDFDGPLPDDINTEGMLEVSQLSPSQSI